MPKLKEKKLKLGILMGTRPEVIKLASLVKTAKESGHELTVINTGQHRELTRPLFDHFDFKPDMDLDVMQPNQTLSSLSSRLLGKLDEHLRKLQTLDALVVQGDTTSAWMGAYWGFLQKIPVVHVEAGLRTGDLSAPFPEEANRVLIGRLSRFNFAPTSGAVKALRREGTPAKHIFNVGNTGIDALIFTLEKQKRSRPELPPLIQTFLNQASMKKSRLGLVTAHRRESFGAGFESICRGLEQSLKKNPRLHLIYPMHPNPNVRSTMQAGLGGLERVLLCEPLDYPQFVYLMNQADVLITDSGGVQEEGPSLKKPILVLRNETERPEGVSKGFATLVGTDPGRIQKAFARALKQGCPARGANPYGDGRSSARILRVLERSL